MLARVTSAFFLLMLALMVPVPLLASERADATVSELPCVPADINERGDVLLNCIDGPYIWRTGDSTSVRVETDATTSGCSHLNDLGQVICSVPTQKLGFLWSAGTGAVELPFGPSAVNNLGEVTGTRVNTQTLLEVWVFRRANGLLVEMGQHGRDSPNCLNNHSQIAGPGGLLSPDGGSVAYIEPRPREFNPNRPLFICTGLNDAGEVSASYPTRFDARVDSFPFEGFLYNPRSGWTTLAVPTDYAVPSNRSTGLNRLGQITGTVTDMQPEGQPSRHNGFFWLTPASPLDLGDYNGLNTTALKSNAAGQIVGYADGIGPDGTPVTIGLLWTLTPAQKIEAISAQLSYLADSLDLSRTEARRFARKVAASLSKLDKGKERQALRTLANEIDVLVTSGQLAPDDADRLSDLVDVAIDSLR